MPIIEQLVSSKSKECFPLPCPAVRRAVAAVALLLLFCCPIPPSGAEGDKNLSLDEALGFAGGIDQYGSIPRLRWLRSAKPGEPPALVETRFEAGGTTLYRVDARTGAATPLYRADALQAALSALPGMDEKTARNASRNASSLRLDDTDRRALLEIGGDIYVYDLAKSRAARVTALPDQRRTDISLSPDGTYVAFVSANDLYVAPVHWDTSGATPPVRVTSDGSARVFNAHLDWVYEEEVYGRGVTSGYRWSADGKRLAFLRLDDTGITPIPLVDDLPRVPVMEPELYPKAGDPNPKASLFVALIGAETAPLTRVNLDNYPDDDRLIARFGFAPDSARLLVQVQNRTQTFLHLLSADVSTGTATKLLEETSPAWVDILDEPRFLADGSFLWRSARTGYRHLYRYGPDGIPRGAVTKGDWDVSDLLAVNEVAGVAYVAGNQTGATQSQVFSIPLSAASGGDVAGTAIPKRISTRDGTHDAAFDPSATLFLDRWNDLGDPTQLRLHAANTGAELRPLGANLLPLTTRRAYRLSTPRLLTIPARDGYKMDAVMLKPTDFVPTKKYPVVYCLYGGPASPTVLDRWGVVSLWHQYLAQQGCIVFLCDNRSASAKGTKNVWGIYKHLGEGETRDIEDAFAYLKTLPYVDGKRVGVYGWSYGGFMVEYLMTHTTLFKAGVAGAGVSDWRLYDSIYTERYMSTPQLNPDGYKETSPVGAAAKLSGRLLLLHGTMDDNVHLQNTVQLIYALQRAGKPFDMMLYPRSRHGISDPALSQHMRTLLTTFLLDNLRAKP